MCLVLVAALPPFIECDNPCRWVEAVGAYPVDWLAVKLLIAVVPNAAVSYFLCVSTNTIQTRYV